MTTALNCLARPHCDDLSHCYITRNETSPPCRFDRQQHAMLHGKRSTGLSSQHMISVGQHFIYISHWMTRPDAQLRVWMDPISILTLCTRNCLYTMPSTLTPNLSSYPKNTVKSTTPGPLAAGCKAGCCRRAGGAARVARGREPCRERLSATCPISLARRQPSDAFFNEQHKTIKKKKLAEKANALQFLEGTGRV